MNQPGDLKLSVMVYCPFFGHLNPSTISCEFLGRKYGITMKFVSVSHKYATMSKWCCSKDGHRGCPIAIAGYQYWEKKKAKK